VTPTWIEECVVDPEDEEWGVNDAEEPGKHSVLIARLAVPVSVATALVVALIAGLMPGTSQGSAADPASTAPVVSVAAPGEEGGDTTPSADVTSPAAASSSTTQGAHVAGVAGVLLPAGPVDNPTSQEPDATATTDDLAPASATTSTSAAPPTKAPTTGKSSAAATTAPATAPQQTRTTTPPAAPTTTSAPTQQATQPAPTQPAPTVTQTTTQPPATKAPITITNVDTGANNVCSPLVKGTAQAGSSVVVSGGGASQTVTADSSGAWSTDRMTGIGSGVTTITASDPSGQVASASKDAIVAAPPIVSVTYQDGVLMVSVNGKAGATAVVLLDGVEIGTIAIGGDRTGDFQYTTTLSPGSHSIGLYYRASGCVGPTAQTSVTA